MPRVILITGAARRLGAGLARALAQDGHRIAIHYRTSRADAEATHAAILKAGGESALFCSALATLDDGHRLAGEVVARFGALDTLINNAGTFKPETVRGNDPGGMGRGAWPARPAPLSSPRARPCLIFAPSGAGASSISATRWPSAPAVASAR